MLEEIPLLERLDGLLVGGRGEMEITRIVAVLHAAVADLALQLGVAVSAIGGRVTSREPAQVSTQSEWRRNNCGLGPQAAPWRYGVIKLHRAGEKRIGQSLVADAGARPVPADEGDVVAERQ